MALETASLPQPPPNRPPGNGLLEEIVYLLQRGLWESQALPSPLATLSGPAAGVMRSASPRLARFLDKAPHDIRVWQQQLEPGTRGLAQRSLIGDLIRALFGKPRSIGVALSPSAPAKTAVHEGLHSSYYVKGQGAFPPNKYMEALKQHFLQRYPQLFNSYNDPYESVVDAMAREVIRRQRIP